MLRRLLSRWRSLNEWVKALLLAFVLLGFLHVFVVRFVTVRSTSMHATLQPGDLVAVTRWNAWTGLDRGDVVVFRDPIQDDRTMVRRQLLVKRVVGMPGDTVRLVDGRLYVNGERVGPFTGETKSHLVRLRKGTDVPAFLRSLGLPEDFAPPERTFVEVPANALMVEALRERNEVLGVEPMGTATGAPRHIFPYSPFFNWNSDDYGPLVVPRRGDTVRIDPVRVALYDRIISRYEGHRITNAGNDLLIDGVKTDRYVVEQDHYFVLGDCRHYSSDSRYWGTVPSDHVVGRAAFIVIPSGTAPMGERRVFKGL